MSLRIVSRYSVGWGIGLREKRGRLTLIFLILSERKHIKNSQSTEGNEKFNKLSTLINVKFKCFFIFYAILMNAKEGKSPLSFHILLCISFFVSDVDGNFHFFAFINCFSLITSLLDSCLFLHILFFFSSFTLIHFNHSTISLRCSRV
jgi:hypothetical protein